MKETEVPVYDFYNFQKERWERIKVKYEEAIGWKFLKCFKNTKSLIQGQIISQRYKNKSNQEHITVNLQSTINKEKIKK